MPAGFFTWPKPSPAQLVSGTALWDWDLGGPDPVVRAYRNGVTKTGLTPNDLQQAVGVPMQYYNTNPPTAVPTEQIITWLRDAEDWIEQETGLLLTPTWIASPPEIQPFAALSTQVPEAGARGQVQGIDYDLADAGYDFIFNRAQDDGWLVQPLRYRPLRNVTTSAVDFTAVKNIAALYPLLSEFFRIPPSWYVEDQDFGLIRLVPAENVQMLPLFAMQLAFMGFSESIPGAWHYQYTAGLTQTDYSSRFRFIKRLVLVTAGIYALGSVQGTLNMGLSRTTVLVDGMQMQLQYPESGPFSALIKNFTGERDALLATALTKVSGPMVLTF
jgi:hypothetical protein